MFYARNSNNKILCTKLFDSNYTAICLDTETTGLKPSEDYIVQFSAIKGKFENGDFIQTDVMDIYIRPPFFMDEKVISIHQITNEMLLDKPFESEILPSIKKFLGENPIIIGYNVSFDVDMICAMYERCGETFEYRGMVDVLEMARDNAPDDMDNYKLGTMCELYGLDEDITFHSAIDDVKATVGLFKAMNMEYRSQVDKRKERLYVNSAYFWKGMNKSQAGIWVDTNLGKVFYSTFKKKWCSSTINLSFCDINALESDVFAKTGIKNYKELSKITEKRFNELRALQ